MKEHNKSNQMIDIGRILKYYLRNWYYFVAAVMLAITITYCYHLYQTPVYSLNTTLLIEDKTANILLPDGTTSIFNSKAIDNEIALLKSHSQIKKIIDQLDFDISYYEKGDLQIREIYKDVPFAVNYSPEHIQPLEIPIELKVTDRNHFLLESDYLAFDGKTPYTFGIPVISDEYSLVIDKVDHMFSDDVINKTFVFNIHKKANLVNSYRNKLNMKLERGTSLLVISTSGTNIQKEKDFLNKLTEVYIEDNLERKNQISNNTIKFIEKQLAQLRQSLDEVESNLENFRKNNNLMKLTDKAVPILSRVNTLNKNKADQMLDLKYYKYLQDYLLTHDNFEDIVAPSTVGISLPLFSDLLLKLSTLQIEKDGLMANSTITNPYIKTLETEIYNQKQVLLENIANVIQVSEMKIKDFDNQISDRLGEFEKLPTLERKYLEISRLYKLNSEMYTYMLEKRAEVEIAKATNVPDLARIDYAGDNGTGKIAPDTRSNYIRSIIFALLIPAILLFLIHVSDRNISDQDDLSALPGKPVFANLPYASDMSGNIVENLPYSDFSVSIKKLSAGVKSLNGENLKIIAVTSSVFGEGKTVIASNLVKSLAQSGRKIMLVNFDFHKHGLHKFFDPDMQSGNNIFPVIDGEANLNNWVYKSNSGLDLFLPYTNDMIGQNMQISELMDAIVLHASEKYDHIIIDTPPLGLTTELLDITDNLDGIIYLVRNKVAPKKILKETMRTLEDLKQLNKILLVFNGKRSRVKSSSYDYYKMKDSTSSIGKLFLHAKSIL